MRKVLWLIMAVATLLILGACQQDGANQESSPSEQTDSGEPDQIEKEEEEEKEETPSAEEPAPAYTYPLTGEPSEEPVDHRVLSVMVNNHTKARPQSGLSQADVVYEVLAEGQITRFLALFHSELPDKIGPVRSAREYYFKLAGGYNAFYTYHGAAAHINDQVAASGIPFFDGASYDNNGWLFERSSERAAPHNSYFLSNGLNQVAEQKGYEQKVETASLPFAEEITEGTAVDQVTITYSNQPQEVVTFDYDAESERFLRSSDGKPSMDEANGERVAVENVFIVETEHRIIDNVGRRAIDLDSGGKGYLLQKGSMKEVQWRNVDGRLLPYEDGEALSFTPGQTWVNIIPGNADISSN
ncbi:DUF3048 domain-containing protein [Halobacillus fulvus]|nr:DUF3048 domain-containing protein [Halobacillus fulvus]